MGDDVYYITWFEFSAMFLGCATLVALLFVYGLGV